MKKVVFPKVLQTKYELDKIQQKTDNEELNLDWLIKELKKHCPKYIKKWKT